jgi:hypothetical protein
VIDVDRRTLRCLLSCKIVAEAADPTVGGNLIITGDCLGKFLGPKSGKAAICRSILRVLSLRNQMSNEPTPTTPHIIPDMNRVTANTRPMASALCLCASSADSIRFK